MKENITLSIFLLALFFSSVHICNGQLISHINYDEIEVSEYQIEKQQGAAVLEMAYAQHRINNPEIWSEVSTSAEVLSVDLIFTKYPRKRNDWITDYDFLLNARIKNLMKLIPGLKGNAQVQWNIVLQNKCVKEPEAQAMFHGAVVRYSKTEEQIITTSLDSQEILKEIDKTPLTPVKLVEKTPEPTDGERYMYMGFYDVDKMLKGKLPIKDSLIFHIFNRNP
jgi:hypothetical protein